MAYANPPFQDLLSIPVDQRDADWEALVLREFPKQNIFVSHPDPKPGPDGWPYLQVETSPEADEPAVRVLDWLSTRGIGLALNPQKEAPDFILTYGMILNYRLRGAFVSNAPERKTGEVRLQPGAQILTGSPSESYLPKFARDVLKQFFLDQGVYAPKVLLISEDRKNFDLCFSNESLGQPPTGEHMGIAEAISWFLPSHYAVAIISEKAIDGFEPL
ncbi:MAG: hypothetical protein NDI61_02885 [Bdellovibrionaceae bacterium]|nr:hypothetical protein [Pseudobdellovibrionaceae bacterium]